MLDINNTAEIISFLEWNPWYTVIIKTDKNDIIGWCYIDTDDVPVLYLSANKIVRLSVLSDINFKIGGEQPSLHVGSTRDMQTEQKGRTYRRYMRDYNTGHADKFLDTLEKHRHSAMRVNKDETRYLVALAAGDDDDYFVTSTLDGRISVISAYDFDGVYDDTGKAQFSQKQHKDILEAVGRYINNTPDLILVRY